MGSIILGRQGEYKLNKSSIEFSSKEFEVSSRLLELNGKVHCARKYKNKRKANKLGQEAGEDSVRQEEDLIIPDESEFG